MVIDAGNTNVVFAIHNGEKWVGSWRMSTIPNHTSDEYAATLLILLQACGIKTDQIDNIIIGTVVPPILYQLRLLCRQWFGVEPLIASSDLDWGFKILIDNPHEVGVDRLLNGLAAHTLFGGPLIVVDLGTATTFDVIDEKGNYCGGIISPGLTLSLESLHKVAARLPKIGIMKPISVIGKETVNAMRSGIYWGYIGLIEGIIKRIGAEANCSYRVIGTGGLASLLAEGTDIFEKISLELTLEGLRLLANRNKTS